MQRNNRLNGCNFNLKIHLLSQNARDSFFFFFFGGVLFSKETWMPSFDCSVILCLPFKHMAVLLLQYFFNDSGVSTLILWDWVNFQEHLKVHLSFSASFFLSPPFTYTMCCIILLFSNYEQLVRQMANLSGSHITLLCSVEWMRYSNMWTENLSFD